MAAMSLCQVPAPRAVETVHPAIVLFHFKRPGGDCDKLSACGVGIFRRRARLSRRAGKSGDGVECRETRRCSIVLAALPMPLNGFGALPRKCGFWMPHNWRTACRCHDVARSRQQLQGGGLTWFVAHHFLKKSRPVYPFPCIHQRRGNGSGVDAC